MHAEAREILGTVIPWCISFVAGCRGAGGNLNSRDLWEETMMTNTKWLRRALLGGAALSVMASSGARADELADLKAQLEALQSRVNTIEQHPAEASNLPPGASFVTFERGSRMDFVAQDPARDRANQNDDAASPSPSRPAPTCRRRWPRSWSMVTSRGT